MEAAVPVAEQPSGHKHGGGGSFRWAFSVYMIDVHTQTRGRFCYPSEPCSGKALLLTYVLWGPCSDYVHVSNAHSLRTPLAPYRWGIMSPFRLCWSVSWLDLIWTCVGSYSYCDFTSAVVLLCSEDMVSLQSSSASISHILPTLLPQWSFSFDGSWGAI